MKKKIDYVLSADEKALLKQQKVTLKMLQDYAPDEIAAMVQASADRARELSALAQFQSIPSLGIGFARELIAQGYYAPDDLKGRTAVELFDGFEKHCGCWADPCVEDSYRLLVHYVAHQDDSKRWWNFTAERKAYRAQHGFPADRPENAWYETGAFPKMGAHQSK
ncbi:MAG: Pathogenicity locus [Mucilaginibacter sp.]|nr:Pathogenicity locus [Mucilaginibacter sp.]